MSLSIKVPTGADIRVLIDPDHGAIVIVAPPPLKADPALLLRPGCVTAMVTHDAGMAWPDRNGCAIASAGLADGWAIFLAFANLANALKCHARLVREAGE